MRSVAAAAFAAAALFAVPVGRVEAGRAGPLLRYLADDSSFVVAIDVAHARKTPIVQRAFELAKGKYAWWRDLAAAGVAPEQVVDTLVVAGEGPLGANEHHTVAIAEGRGDKLAKIVAALAQHGKRGPVRAGIATWTLDAGAELAIVDRHLIVTAPGGLAMVIDRARGKLRGSGPTVIREILDATSGGTDIVAGVALDAPSRQQIASVIAGEPRWVACSVAAASQLVIQVALDVGDGDHAAQVRDQLASKLADPSTHGELEQGIGKGFSDSLAVDQDGSQVRISATLTTDEADKLLSLLQIAM